MKVVLLTSDYHVSANIGLKAFLDHPGLKKHDIQVAGIIMAEQFSFGKKHFKRTAYFFRKSNFIFLAKNILTNVWKKIRISIARYLMPNSRREFYAIDEMAKMHSIPFLKAESINTEEAKNFIKSKKPDLLVSCFLLEILKTDILEIPEKGSINVHPALVQKHRGAFSAFWTIAKNWKRHGATVHYMNEAVDEGDVILQKHFFVYPSDTVYTVNKKAAELSGRLLVKALINIKKKRVRKLRIKKATQLFSFPNPLELKCFYARGKSLISAKDFFNL